MGHRQHRPWYVDCLPGERLASFWLSLGRSRDDVVAELVRSYHLDEAAAWVAVDAASTIRSRDAHPAGGGVAPEPLEVRGYHLELVHEER